VNASELPLGQKALIRQCLDVRLEELGFDVGETITRVHSSPFNGASAVRVGASLFALNKAELSCLIVEVRD